MRGEKKPPQSPSLHPHGCQEIGKRFQALSITLVKYLTLQTMLIQFNAAPKQIELQKQAWSHLKVFEKGL